MDRIELSLGPCFFNWPVDDLADFYARIADEAPVDRVYLGEVICGKRMPFTDPIWPGLIERLERAGKTVVISMLALPTTTRERKAMAELAMLHPVGHVGDPADVAATVAFLASEDARFVSGQVIVVDGARTVKLSLPPSLSPQR